MTRTKGRFSGSPGKVSSYSLRVSNGTGAAENLIESLTLPPGWQAITSLGILPLGPHETQVRLIAVPVPRGTAAGRYEVAYSVRSQRDYSLQDEASAAVAVPTVDQLSLLAETKPDFVIAGEDYEVTVRAVNRGNAGVNASLRVRSEEGCPATIAPTQMALPPGASQTATITVRTSKPEKQPRQNALQIEAVGADGTKPRAALTVCVDIIPRITSAMDLERRLPARLALQTVGDAKGAGVQVELSGSGALDDAQTRRLSFLFRGPDTQSDGLFGLHDEYWIDYSSPPLDVVLGDRTYGLSPLTDAYRYGRGASVDVRPFGGRRAPEIGAYCVHSRWERPALGEGGGHLTYDLDSRISLTLSFLAARRGASEMRRPTAQRVWSVQAAVQPVRDTTVEVEYAGSLGEREGEEDLQDTAYRVTADTRLGDSGRFSLSRTRAGPDFAGYYSDSDYTNAAVTLPVTKRLRARALFGQWSQNLERRLERMTAPRESLYEVGLDYALSPMWYAALDWDRFARRDLLAPPGEDYAEQSLKLSLGYSSRRASVRWEVRAGDQSSAQGASHSPAARCNLYGTFRPSDQLAVSLSGSLGSGRSAPESRLLDGANSVTASLDWKPSDSTALRVSYLRYHRTRPWRDNEQVDLSATHARRDGTQWELRVLPAWPSLSRDSQVSYMLNYSIPFGVPLGKRTDVGRIRGRIYDAQESDQRGIANAILCVGKAVAVSDANGRFTFPALSPGRYAVSLDRKSIGLSRVTQQTLPLMVEVTEGTVQEVDIGVVPAAKVTGTVVVVPRPDGSPTDATGAYVVGDPRQPDASSEPAGLPNTLVELTDGNEVWRTVTDSGGGFIFESLRPGLWHLKTYEDNLREYYFLDNPELDLQLPGGQVAKVAVRALPKVRRIHMVDLTATLATLDDPSRSAGQK